MSMGTVLPLHLRKPKRIGMLGAGATEPALINHGVQANDSVLAENDAYWNAGDSFPSGWYRVEYVEGYHQYRDFPDIRYKTGGVTIHHGGGTFAIPSNHEHTTPEAAEAGAAGWTSEFYHTGGAIFMRYADSNYGDNANGDPNTTLRLLKLNTWG